MKVKMRSDEDIQIFFEIFFEKSKTYEKLKIKAIVKIE